MSLSRCSAGTDVDALGSRTPFSITRIATFWGTLCFTKSAVPFDMQMMPSYRAYICLSNHEVMAYFPRELKVLCSVVKSFILLRHNFTANAPQYCEGNRWVCTMSEFFMYFASLKAFNGLYRPAQMLTASTRMPSCLSFCSKTSFVDFNRTIFTS